MEKPGLARAIPAMILGFIAGALVVLLIRMLQNMDPVWDAGVTLVVTPFVMTYAFVWGMGGFNPKMSEHAHGPEDHHEETAIVPADEAHHDDHAEEEDGPFAVLSSQIWRIATSSIVVLIVMFSIATLPLGLFLQTVGTPEGNPAAIATNQVFDLPLGLGQFEASQLTVFIGFIIVLMLSLLAIGGLLGFLFVSANQGVTEVREHPATPLERRPPAPVRAIGGFLSRFARGVRNAIPGFFGIK